MQKKKGCLPNPPNCAEEGRMWLSAWTAIQHGNVYESICQQARMLRMKIFAWKKNVDQATTILRKPRADICGKSLGLPFVALCFLVGSTENNAVTSPVVCHELPIEIARNGDWLYFHSQTASHILPISPIIPPFFTHQTTGQSNSFFPVHFSS